MINVLNTTIEPYNEASIFAADAIYGTKNITICRNKTKINDHIQRLR